MPSEDVPLRDLQGARDAYDAKDAEASKGAHDIKVKLIDAEEKHSKMSENLKSVVYGGLDGIITTFAVVSGAAGGGFGIDVILVLGFANMFADALSMGMGDTLSTMASNEAVLKERAREQWEFETYPEGEIKEMIQIYESKGMSHEDAESVIKTMAKYKKFFIDRMMVDELGLQVPDEDDNPYFDGLVTFCSFVFFGVFPLLGYVATVGQDLSSNQLFGISIGLTGAMLFVLGALKSMFTAQSWLYSGTEILLFGGLTAAVSYLIGWFVEEIALG